MSLSLRQSWRIIATVAMILSLIAGSLAFAAEDTTAQTGKTINLQIIVDQSGSMAAETDTGVLRIDAAKTVLNEVIAQIPEAEGVNVGFRVYGHLGNNQPEGKPQSCVSSELLVPMQGVDKAALTAQVNALVPVGWTPLGYALEQAAADFTQPANEDVVNAIIMVTDGLETCGADPAAIAGQLKNSEAGITTHVIGFGTNPDELAILEGITQASGGQLLGSNNAGQLISALFEILEELEVVEESGTGADRNSPIALGRTGRVGNYDVTVISAGPAPEPVGTTGGYDYTVSVSATYRGERQGNPQNDLRFSASGDLGITYTLPNNECAVMTSSLSSTENLFEGGTAEFNMCWLVGANDIESLMMSVSGGQEGESGRLWFALDSNVPVATSAESQPAPYFEVVARDIEYSPTSLTIPANTDVVIGLTNDAILEHNIVIQGTGIESSPISGGGYLEIVVNLPPGTYTFHCTVPGHTEAGQTGLLNVVP